MIARNQFIVRFIVEQIETVEGEISHYCGEVTAIDGPIVDDRDQAEAKICVYADMAKVYEDTMVKLTESEDI